MSAKNQTVKYLDNTHSKHHQMVLKGVICIGRKHCQAKKVPIRVTSWITRPQQQKLKQKLQNQDQPDRNAFERGIKEGNWFLSIPWHQPGNCHGHFSKQHHRKRNNALLDHRDECQLFHGTVLCLMANPKETYQIQYLNQGERRQQSSKNYTSKFTLVVDLLFQDSNISLDLFQCGLIL